MRFERRHRLPLVLVLAGLGAGTPAKEETPADKALKEKGLTRTGTTYVLESEKPVLVKLKEARAGFNALAAMSDEKGGVQALAERATELESQRVDLQNQIDNLNQQISMQPPQGGPGGGPGGGFGGIGGLGGIGSYGAGQNAGPSPLMMQRQQVQQMLMQVTNEQRAVKNQTPQPRDNQALDKRIQKAEEGFKTTLTDLRKQVDGVQQEYAQLDGNDDVRKSLAESKKANPRNKLGPSDAFTAAVRELDKAEQRFLDKPRATSKAASKKKDREKAATAKGKKGG